MSIVVGVDLAHEVSDIVVGEGAGNVLLQDGLDLLEGHNVALLLIEDTEAFLGLVFAATLGGPSVGDGVLAEGEVDTVTFHEFTVALYEVGVDVAHAQTVEPEVVQDVLEVVDRNVAGVLLVVEAEGLLQVGKLVTGQRVGVVL